jgi:hypothetical protein
MMLRVTDHAVQAKGGAKTRRNDDARLIAKLAETGLVLAHTVFSYAASPVSASGISVRTRQSKEGGINKDSQAPCTAIWTFLKRTVIVLRSLTGSRKHVPQHQLMMDLHNPAVVRVASRKDG